MLFLVFCEYALELAHVVDELLGFEALEGSDQSLGGLLDALHLGFDFDVDEDEFVLVDG
jgi:hypothetical protein